MEQQQLIKKQKKKKNRKTIKDQEKREEVDLTNLKSETTTNQEQEKKKLKLIWPLAACTPQWGEGATNVVWWSKGDFSFLSMRVCVCLKIMKRKGKQDYVRRITERSRECSGIK